MEEINDSSYNYCPIADMMFLVNTNNIENRLKTYIERIYHKKQDRYPYNIIRTRLFNAFNLYSFLLDQGEIQLGEQSLDDHFKNVCHNFNSTFATLYKLECEEFRKIGIPFPEHIEHAVNILEEAIDTLYLGNNKKIVKKNQQYANNFIYLLKVVQQFDKEEDLGYLTHHPIMSKIQKLIDNIEGLVTTSILSKQFARAGRNVFLNPGNRRLAGIKAMPFAKDIDKNPVLMDELNKILDA